MSTYVRPEGDPDRAKIIIVGEQPGKTEVQSGRPFVGPAGRELNECLKAAGVIRQECYITNFAKDFDQHVSEYLNLSTLTFSEKGLKYRDLLIGEINDAKAIAVIAMGNYSMTALTNINKPGITKWRGSVLTDDRMPGKYIIPTIHTSTILPPKFVYLNKFLIQLDIKRARVIADNGHTPKFRKLIIKPTYFEIMSYLAKIEKEGTDGKIIYFDIELLNEEVSCISFAYRDDEALCIPFVAADGDYLTIEQETNVFQHVADILEDGAIRKGGQNLGFDTHFLLRRYGIKAKNLEDTMVAQRIIMPDYPIGLDFITSVWTDHRYYKDEGKRYFGTGGEQLWKYNATDSIMCAEAFPKQIEKLEQQGNIETYYRQVKLIPPLVYMQERGIKMDMDGIRQKREDLAKEAEQHQEKLNKIAGFHLNPNSPKQLKEYFYGRLKFPAYKNRRTKAPTTDDDAMKRLAKKGVKEANLIRKIRKCVKLSGTYLNEDKFDPDGRVRCSFNPVGTRFSRLSSSANIFGTGMNLQNVPHELLKFFLFDDNYVGYRIDLSQAENRIVAYVGNITPMIDCFERKDDVHKLTASLIFQKPASDITTEDGTCSLGDGSHNERFWGKKANHALNYDLGYKSFAHIYETTEREAHFIVERYHMAYPGVRNNFHVYVRKCLRENRIITNLMGRRTLFMDRWGDKLFKDAYSCIPQGTVGDVINERGVIELYYQEKYALSELLLQVHDDVTFQIPKSVPYEEHAKMILDVKSKLEIPLTTHYGREFIIPADVTICPRTLAKEDGKDLKSHEVPSTAVELAEIIRTTVESYEARA